MSATKDSIQSGKSSQKKQQSPGGRLAQFFLRNLEKLIELPDSVAAEQVANGRLLIIFSWLNIIVMTIMVVAELIVSPEQVIRPLIVVVPVNTLFLIVISLVGRSKVLLASYLTVGMLWLMVTLFALSGGGVDAPSYVGYFVVTFLSGILIGGSAVFFMTLICGLTGLGMVYLEYIGRLPAAQYQHSPLTYWIGVSAFMLIVAFLQYYNSQVAKGALRQAHEELSERTRVEEMLQQKSRSLYMLSNCNQALVYISDEHRLLQEMCRICVEDGGYRLAWVGFAENDPEKTVRPVAQFGFEDEYLASAQITWADTERGRGPTGRAIRSGEPCITRDFLTDPQALPWRDAAIQRGYASSIALPLIMDGRTIGAFMLYDRKPNAFTPDEVKLLVELSMDMAFGIKSLRNHAVQLELQEELIRSDARYRLAQRSAHIGSWEWNAQTNTMFWSDEMFDLFDKKFDEFIPTYQTMLECIVPENRLDAQEFVENALQVGEPFEENFRVLESTGKVKWLNIKGDVIHEESGKNVLMSGTIQDVTELKTTQHALQELNRDLERRVAERTAEVKDLYDHAPTGYHSLDANGIFQMVNATELKWLGYTEEEMIGRLSFADIVATEDMGKFEREFQHFKQQGHVDHLEFNLKRKDGSIMPVIINSTAIFDKDGNFLHSRSNMIDNTERKKAQEELRQREAMYRALFENSNDGIFLFTPDGENELQPNQRALDMTGYTADEYMALSKNQRNILAPVEEQQDSDERLESLVNGEQVPLYERTFITKSGKRISAEINLSPIRDQDGNIVLVQSVVRDVTERKQAEDALRANRDDLSLLNVALEKASKLKDEFLSSMSHELRTPLTGILGLSESLELETYGTLNEKQLRSVQMIESSGRHLLDLINDILDLSKIEAGKLDLQFETVSVAKVCESCLQMIKGMSHQKKQTVQYSINPSTLQIRADERRLKQMIVNLLSNAVKFTAEGGSLGLIVEGKDQEERVYFTVWDKGIGIKAEDMERLFKPFVQLDSKLSRQYSGTGLGLSLVQRMAELHNGSVRLESIPGEGSRFTVILPWIAEVPTAEVATEENDVSSPQDSTETAPLSSSHLVALCDDNELNLEMISDFLIAKGCRVVTFSNGYKLLNELPLLHPDIILLDIQMPVMDGLEAIQRLRSHEDRLLAATPIIAVTALAMSGDREKCLAAGANDYMSKPVSLRNLTLRIKEWIAQKNQNNL